MHEYDRGSMRVMWKGTAMDYRTREEWARALIDKQPAFMTLEEAIAFAVKRIKSGEDLPDIYQEPKNGKYLVANSQAFEVLVQHGYKRVLDVFAMRDMVKNT